MKTELLNYDLPAELIAQHPARVRSQSRLLVLDSKAAKWTDSSFEQIGGWLRAGDCLVLNDTKVIPARFFMRRNTGGRIEGLFLDEESGGKWIVMLKGAARLKKNEELQLIARDTSIYGQARILDELGEGNWRIEVPIDPPAFEILEQIGMPPLPPYIKRGEKHKSHPLEEDIERYQTVYARQPGAIAAPTAGLHFTKELIDSIQTAGIHIARITLHVGVGTFKPVAAETLDGHRMHAEEYNIDQPNADLINKVKADGGRIVAVGTTVVRTLEAVAKDSRVKAGSGMTDIFIKPGYRFRMVDAMVTNFHLPKSTLLALAAAFAGLDLILAAYRHAVEQKYRFYSYGDAMLIL